MQEGVGSEGGVAPRPPRHSKAPGLCRLQWQCCAWSTKKGTELTTRQAAVCDGGPRGGEEADWAHLQVPLHGSGARVGSGPIRGVGPSSPNTCPLQFTLFSTRIFFIFSHKSSRGRGTEGEEHTGCYLQGLSINRHWCGHAPACPQLCSAQLSPPRDTGEHLPGSLGLGGEQQGWPWTVWPGHLPSWDLLPASPSPAVSTELPVWVNLGIFFWGIVLLHDPP